MEHVLTLMPSNIQLIWKNPPYLETSRIIFTRQVLSFFFIFLTRSEMVKLKMI